MQYDQDALEQQAEAEAVGDAESAKYKRFLQQEMDDVCCLVVLVLWDRICSIRATID